MAKRSVLGVVLAGILGSSGSPAAGQDRPPTNSQVDTLKTGSRASGPASKSDALLTELLVAIQQEEDPGRRQWALDVLGRAGRSAVPGLLAALDGREYRVGACMALARLGADAEAAFPGLTDALRDDRPAVRREAALALAALGPAASPAVPSLARALKDPATRAAATYALAKVGAAARVADAELRQQTQSPDSFLRIVSFWALARMYPEDRRLVEDAVSKLSAALGDAQPAVRQAAARALLELDAPAARPWRDRAARTLEVASAPKAPAKYPPASPTAPQPAEPLAAPEKPQRRR